MNSHLVRSVVATVCGTLVLAACSDKPKEQKPASQVAAKVNGGEVSIHQVNEQMQRLPNVPAAQQDLARKQAVEGLIDQQLLVQQANDRKLERDPDVLAALEQGRAQILAQAYLQKTVVPKAKPTPDAVKQYYSENPALFSQRRVFRLQEISTNFPADRVAELKKVVAQSKSMSDVAKWLQAGKFQVMANSAVRGTEQLPLQQVAAINEMKDGEMAVFSNEGKASVLQVLASQSQPLDETKAAPLIEQFLGTRKRDELVRAEVARLREGAKIEYVGEFAKLAQLDPNALKGDSAAPTGEAAKGPEASASAASASEAVDKGLSGLR